MVKPSEAFGLEPFLHLVGDGLGRADHGEAANSRRAAARAGAPSGSRAWPSAMARSRPLLRGVALRDSPAAARPDRTSRHRGRARSTARRWRWRSSPGCRAWRASSRASSTVSPTTTKQAGRIFMWSRIAAEPSPCGPSRRRRTPGRPSMLGCAVNTASAVSAASWRPASDAPACTITGQPCTGRAMLSGPRTERYSPLWSSTCILSGSKKMPLSTSRMKASSAQESHSPVTTS